MKDNFKNFFISYSNYNQLVFDENGKGVAVSRLHQFFLMKSFLKVSFINGCVYKCTLVSLISWKYKIKNFSNLSTESVMIKIISNNTYEIIFDNKKLLSEVTDDIINVFFGNENIGQIKQHSKTNIPNQKIQSGTDITCMARYSTPIILFALCIEDYWGPFT